MEGEKSKVCCNGENDEEEDEKMEQFFALIRNFREARDRRKDELRQREEATEKKQQNKARRVNNSNDEQSSWVPCFEWADFTEEIEFRRPPITFPSPFNNKDDNGKQPQRRDDDGLDLKLTL